MSFYITFLVDFNSNIPPVVPAGQWWPVFWFNLAFFKRKVWLFNTHLFVLKWKRFSLYSCETGLTIATSFFVSLVFVLSVFFSLDFSPHLSPSLISSPPSHAVNVICQEHHLILLLSEIREGPVPTFLKRCLILILRRVSSFNLECPQQLWLYPQGRLDKAASKSCLLESLCQSHREVRIKPHSSKAQNTVRTMVLTPQKRGSNTIQPGQQSGWFPESGL